MGERDFDAQYNQRPLPPGGALFKLEWLKRYSVAPALHQVELIVQSWDTAYEIGPNNDYSACTTWAISGTRLYLLDVFRARLHFHDLQKAVFEQRKQWDAQLVIVEGIGAGLSVFQNITKGRGYHWLKTLKPVTSKQDRASKHTPRFERGEILLPETAPWLQSFESELLNFPHGPHDDQVDSMTQFFDGIATGNLLKYAKGVAPETYIEVA
jgi:predicted phage terminase large subunit-like protein